MHGKDSAVSVGYHEKGAEVGIESRLWGECLGLSLSPPPTGCVMVASGWTSVFSCIKWSS